MTFEHILFPFIPLFLILIPIYLFIIKPLMFKRKFNKYYKDKWFVSETGHVAMPTSVGDSMIGYISYVYLENFSGQSVFFETNFRLLSTFIIRFPVPVSKTESALFSERYHNQRAEERRISNENRNVRLNNTINNLMNAKTSIRTKKLEVKTKSKSISKKTSKKEPSVNFRLNKIMD